MGRPVTRNGPTVIGDVTRESVRQFSLFRKSGVARLYSLLGCPPDTSAHLSTVPLRSQVLNSSAVNR